VTVFSELADFVAAVGVELGPTGRLLIGQATGDQFAQSIDDHQWIHVQPRAVSGLR
jgi:acyl dehydratase